MLLIYIFFSPKKEEILHCSHAAFFCQNKAAGLILSIPIFVESVNISNKDTVTDLESRETTIIYLFLPFFNQ